MNAGFNSDCTQDNVRLERESKALKEIDINGKILETSDVYWDVKANNVDPNNPRALWGVRRNVDGVPARNFTIANRIALDRGADWIVRFYADQVFYESAKLIPAYIAKHPSCGYQFLEYDGWVIDIYHREKNAQSEVVDGAMLYRTSPGDCHIGACSPMVQPQTLGPPIYEIYTAHLKQAYPPGWSMEKIRKNVHERIYKQSNISWRLGSWASNVKTLEEFEEIIDKDEKNWWHVMHTCTQPTDVPAPLVCKLEPLKYIQEGQPK